MPKTIPEHILFSF